MGTARDTMGVAFVSDTSPLWVRKNSPNTEHECLFAMCNDCKDRMPVCRGRGSKHKTRNDNDTSNCENNCDHSVSGLDIFFDSKYFSNSHMEGVIKNGPAKCFSCNKILSNRVAV